MGIIFKKSPSPHVSGYSDRSTGRTTFPFASANYISFKDHLQNNNEAQRCVENFLEALEHHQLVLKNSKYTTAPKKKFSYYPEYLDFFQKKFLNRPKKFFIGFNVTK